MDTIAMVIERIPVPLPPARFVPLSHAKEASTEVRADSKFFHCWMQLLPWQGRGDDTRTPFS